MSTDKKNGVKVVSAKEAIADDSTGILLESLLEGYAEFYSAELSEKVIRGMTENALKKKYNGGGVPIGYTIDQDNHFQIDPITAPLVHDAFTKYSKGAKIQDITDELNAKGLRGFRGRPLNSDNTTRLLKNRKYTGEYKYRDILDPHGIPEIVPLELYERVQLRFRKNQKAPARSKAEESYLLTTKLRCGTSPIYCEQADKLLIILADGSTNTITDPKSYIFPNADTDEPNAAVFSKVDMTINGTGKLTVNANYNNGIGTKDDLMLVSGTPICAHYLWLNTA